MKRRNWLKKILLGSGAMYTGVPTTRPFRSRKKGIRVAHITDVHIRPENNIPERARQTMEDVLAHGVDFFLNGGDSIHDASYDDVTRERVLEQWEEWDRFVELAQDYEMFSCLGNHDMWWKAPSKDHDMYGKPYAVKRLGMPARYFSVSRGGWHIIILDSNQSGVRLDENQFQWLEEELEKLPENKPVLLMSHYPILGVTDHFVGGQHSDFEELKTLFYKHRDKVKLCLSGHQHMVDRAWYNGVEYLCNGSMSGYWWGEGDEHSAGKGYYLESPPGYAILDLFPDGTFHHTYYPHSY